VTAQTHSQLANFIWCICNLLLGPYNRNEYRKVILPLTVLRRFDCLLAPTKAAVLEEYLVIKKEPETVVRSLLQKITKRPFYNLSKLDFPKLLDDPNQLAPNLNSYINKFSANVRDIIDRFGFDEHIARMAEKNLLYEVIKAFAKIDLSSSHIDNVQMGYVFEELIRIGAEQANEEAGEHFTPREVIKLMVNLLLSPEKDLTHSHVVKSSITCWPIRLLEWNGSSSSASSNRSGTRWVFKGASVRVRHALTMVRSFSSSTCCPRCVNQRKVAVALALSSTARLFSRAT